MSDDCLFCRIIAGKIPARTVLEDEHALAFDDISPQAPVHTLVVPRRHIATLDDATDDDALLLGRLLRVATKVAALKGISESGYRTVVNTRAGAGQSVFHVHLHVLGGRPLAWPPG